MTCYRSLVLTTMLVLVIFAGCGGKKQEETQSVPTKETVEERNEWEERITADLLSGETVLEQAMAEAVEIQVEEAGEGCLEVTITAPNISEELIAWMRAVSEEDYSDEALEAEMLGLLKEKEAAETKVMVEYENSGDELVLDYHREFSNALTCGLLDFYMEMNRQMMEEMKETAS